MCGIVGGLRLESASGISPEHQNDIMRIMFVELLLLTESRGSDATGCAALFDDGNFYAMKHGEKASKLVSDFGRASNDNFLAWMDVWKYYKRPANIVMGHCRKKTTGLATDNRNNHPFKSGNMFGIHNGVIENHNKIEELLKDSGFKFERDGIVDSEMIFHLLNKAVGKEKILTLDHIEWVVNRLQGKYAVMAANVNNPYQMMLFRDGRPVEVALSRPAGLVFVASEKGFLETALFRYKRIKEYYGLDYLPDLDLTSSVMPDDHAWVVNLAHKVDENTSFNELVEGRKMPFLAAREKDWQVKTTTTYSYGHHAGHRNNAWNHNRSTANNTKTKTESDKEGDWKPGRVWCNKTRKYVDKTSENDTPASARGGSATTNDELNSRVPEKFRTTEKEDAIVMAGVEVEDLTDYVIKEPDKGKERSRTEIRRRSGVKAVNTTEIVDDEKDVTLEEVIKTYAKRKGHFNNTADALRAAEVKEEQLNSMEFRYIANRIRRKAVEEAFRDGFEAASAQTKETTGYSLGAIQKALVKLTTKKKKAEKRIKSLKALSLFLIELVERYGPAVGEISNLDADFLDELNETVGPHYSLTMEEALDLFSDYEIKSMPFFTSNTDKES